MPTLPRFVHLLSRSIHHQGFLPNGSRASRLQRWRRCFTTTFPAGVPRFLWNVPSITNSRVRSRVTYHIAATWLIPVPGNVLPEEVIRRFPRLDPVFHKQLRNVVIVVTPAFAEWLRAEEPFLEAALHHLYGNFTHHKKSRGFQSSVAVVDRLPGQPFSPDATEAVPSKAPVRAVDGQEGIALWIDSINFDPDILCSFNDDEMGQRLVRMTFTRPWSSWDSVISVEIRPANTLFINGSQSTMFHDSWELDPSDGPKLKRIGHRKPLKTLEFFVPSDAPKFSAPLETLTRGREILSCMGNVIRQLKSQKDGEPLPASAELEEKVPLYLGRKSGTDGTLAVFALVTPSRLRKTPELDGPLEPSEENIVEAEMSSLRRALLAGAHLHRVTSGGGGWGKKQGLLSLDPAFDFAKHDDTGSLDAMLQGETPGDGPHSRNAVNPGDYVQFFASYQPEQQALENLQFPSTKDFDTFDWGSWHWKRLKKLRTIVGSLPSQDAFSTPLQDDEKTDSKIIAVPDQFGMLSAGGMCLRRCKIEPRNAQPEPDVTKPKDGHRKMKQLSVSRIDISHGFWEVLSGDYPPYPLQPKVRRIPITARSKEQPVHLSDPCKLTDIAQNTEVGWFRKVQSGEQVPQTP